MTYGNELRYDTLPRVMPLYARAAANSLRRVPNQPAMPALAACISGVTVDTQRLSRYCRVCAFNDSGTLPITYPHVLAFPLHMAIMTARTFPLKLAGLVHVRNRITQYRPLLASEVFDLSVRVGDQRTTTRGREFDLVTEVRDGSGHMVWAEVSTMLSRQGKQGGGSQNARRHADTVVIPEEHMARWHVDAAVGRRYAAAAGDCNPIHLSAISARLFGFSRAIATGMWLKARVAAELIGPQQAGALRLQLAFEKPVLLPSVVDLCWSRSAAGATFALASRDRKKRYLQGDVSCVRV